MIFRQESSIPGYTKTTAAVIVAEGDLVMDRAQVSPETWRRFYHPNARLRAMYESWIAEILKRYRGTHSGSGVTNMPKISEKQPAKSFAISRAYRKR